MRKYLNTLLSVGAASTLTLALTLLPQRALAQGSVLDETMAGRISGGTGLGTNDPATVVVLIINVLLGFLALITVILIIYAGFTWMTAAGNEDKIATAKQTLLASVVGLLIIAAAWGITIFVVNLAINATG